MIKRVSKLILKLKSICRERKASFHFVSFPKSGRTWINVFLAKYFSLNSGKAVNLNLPGIIFNHGKFDFEQLADIEKYIISLKSKKIIFLARDPRDVAVSYYFHSKKRDPRFSGKEQKNNLNMGEFIRDQIMGIERIIEFMNLWYQQRELFKDFLLIRYEDCGQNTAKEFEKILKFLGKEINKEALEKAINFSSFDNMKKIEKDNLLEDDRLRAADSNDPESFKVRKGKIGGYKDYFSEEDIKYSNEKMRNLNKDFGYHV